MNWNNLYTELVELTTNMTLYEIPHQFNGDAAGWSVLECLKWINAENQAPMPLNFVPIYGEWNSGSYEGDCRFLLIDITAGKFYDISGSHCSCYGFEGQFIPELCPIEYLTTGKPCISFS